MSYQTRFNRGFRDGFSDVLTLQLFGFLNSIASNVVGPILINWGTSKRTYETQSLPIMGTAAVCASLADINQDGWLDFFVVYEGSGVAASWYNQGGGVRNFTEYPFETTLSSPRWIDSADFDGNGYPDPVVLFQDSENIYLFLNQDGWVSDQFGKSL